jgi:hypothetical protein
MGKLLVTEQEKKRILGLYGLLKEDIDPSSGGTVTINNVYKAGWYTTAAMDQLTNQTIKDQLDAELVKVTEFVRKYPNSIVSVKFTSQESSLPNTDNEKAGFFKGKQNNRLEVGELSGARKAYIDQYVQSYFQSLKDQGVIKTEVQIPPVQYEFKPPTKPFMGNNTETPWCIKGDAQIPANDTQGYTCTGANYKVNGSTANNWYNQKLKSYKSQYDAFVKEQNSSIEITVRLAQIPPSVTPPPSVVTTTTTVKPDCAAGLKIRIYVPDHQCQNAEFFLFANKTILYNSVGGYTANLNNNNEKRGVPAFTSQPMLPAWLLNPGYGDLKNGDGTYSSYGYGKPNPLGDIGAGRSDTFVITPEQSAEIVKDGKIDFYFIATTDDAHDDIPEVDVIKDGLTLVDEKGETVENPIDINSVRGRLFTTDACGTTLIRNTKKLGKEDESAYSSLKAQYVNILVAEREKMMNNSGIANKIRRIFKDEPDSKGLDLSRADNLKTKMLELLKKINAKEKLLPADFQKYYTEFYDIINFSGGTSFDRAGNISNGGPFTYKDKTINSDKLFGDIRRRLGEFYDAFDAIYYDSDESKILPTGLKLNDIRSNIEDLPTWQQYLTI